MALVLVLVGGLLAGFAGTAGAATFAATYTVPAAPTSIPLGNAATVAVTLINTGTSAWNATGAQPVNLSYHWYDATGTAVVWDGARTSLAADVPPSGTAVVSARVLPPTAAGTYLLRFALVKEGVGWFDPEAAAHSVAVPSPFQATFGQVTLPQMLGGGTYTVAVPVTNAGTAVWNAAAPQPVDLSYHWIDAAGNGVVWDGVRTKLAADVAPGAMTTVNATIVAPPAPGTYTLALDMVKEGLAWFGQWSRLPATIATPTYRANYAIGASLNAFIGDAKTLPVTVTNLGNVTWSSLGASPVNLSYHWFDASGANVVLWDGPRTPLAANVDPGASATVQMSLTMPGRPGTYTLMVELVREGVAWFSTLGSTPASMTFSVTSGLGASWGADTTPASMTSGSGFPASITVTNSGQKPWPAAGPNPVRLSYHVYDAGGGLVVWDGTRSALPKDVAPGETATINAVAFAPSTNASYTIRWDLVQEGVAWFSTYGIGTKSDPLQVFAGVTIYGKGWGHGVGMSQWGAQGWATGAGGTPLTGEQIVQKYFPGSTFGPTPSKPLHVLLSSPSTGCNGRSIFNIAQLRSDGGIRVVKWWDPTQVIMNAVGSQTVRVFMNGNTIQVMDEWSGTIVYSGTDTIGLVPGDATKPITIDQKLRWYRGLIALEPLGFNALRVVNEVAYDDYARGSVPSEMLTGWHVEAYKSQAYAAKSYAAWRQSSNTSRFWDVRDDTADQCYGGASVESTIVNQAVAATAGRLATYAGAPIKAYYSSSDGGSSESAGCVWNVVRDSSGHYSCGGAEPYLVPVPDPADLAAVGPAGPNPQRGWVVTFTSAQIQNAVLNSGYNIGVFLSLDLTNTGPGGHVISVRVKGTAGTVELPADMFMRTRLGLKSTMARIYPF